MKCLDDYVSANGKQWKWMEIVCPTCFIGYPINTMNKNISTWQVNKNIQNCITILKQNKTIMNQEQLNKYNQKKDNYEKLIL